MPSTLFGSVNAPDPRWPYNAALHLDQPLGGPDGIQLVVDPTNPFGTYADGYKAHADLGVDHALENGDVDVLVYPIAFCYRHYLELRLKQLLLIAGEYVEQPQTNPMQHSLQKLWAAVRPLLGSIWGSQRAERDYDEVNRVLEEFEKFDPNSEAFRYPVDGNDRRYLNGLEYINLRKLQAAVDKIKPILDGATYGIEEFLDLKAELRAEAHFES